MQLLVEFPGFYIGNIYFCNRAVKTKISSHMECAISLPELDDNDEPPLDMAALKEKVAQLEMAFEEAWKELKDIERIVLLKRKRGNLNEQIGTEEDLSGSRISQIFNEAKNKMKTKMYKKTRVDEIEKESVDQVVDGRFPKKMKEPN